LAGLRFAGSELLCFLGFSRRNEESLHDPKRALMASLRVYGKSIRNSLPWSLKPSLSYSTWTRPRA
jgi:hypothetical protein